MTSLVSRALALIAFTLPSSALAQTSSPLNSQIDALLPAATSLYRDLHRAPELSGHETATAARLAAQLTPLGYEVTTGVGKTGIVAVLRNGPGPTVMLRTELDALPVTEATGLAFASTVRVKDDAGTEVGVMHACGHDLHMSAWTSTARIMANDRASWRGTLVLIGQPAEETGAGAAAMIKDGLLTRFPRPDVAIAVHDDARRPAGEIAHRAGPILSNADALTIRIYGRGGHGARPETTIDPIVIAARTVVALQTIVAREMSPFDPAVITVGSIHGGTKNNIIPDDVVMQLTVRSFTDAVRTQLLKAIDRVVKAEAVAGGAVREPTIDRIKTATALQNDSTYDRRIASALARELGGERVVEGTQEMVSEDFSELHLGGVPTVMLRVGATPLSLWTEAQRTGAVLPSLHSSKFAPDLEPTMRATIAAEVTALRELMPVLRP